MAGTPEDGERELALAELRKRLLRNREIDGKVRTLRLSVRDLKKEYDHTEDDLKALQSVGQIVGEVLRQLDEERCECVGWWWGWWGWVVAGVRMSVCMHLRILRACTHRMGERTLPALLQLHGQRVPACKAHAQQGTPGSQLLHPSPHAPNQSSSRRAAGPATWSAAAAAWTRPSW